MGVHLHEIGRGPPRGLETPKRSGQARLMRKRESDARALTSIDRIEQTILRVRGHSVILDVDLAALYGTTTSRFNEQVRRNARRFPPDFMFRLTREEYGNLRSQIAISSSRAHGGRRFLPLVFTEHGAIMAANVVKSRSAVQMSIVVVRAFVRLRQLIQSHADLAGSSTRSRRSTMNSSPWCFRRSGNSWRHRPPRGKGLDSGRRRCEHVAHVPGVADSHYTCSPGACTGHLHEICTRF